MSSGPSKRSAEGGSFPPEKLAKKEGIAGEGDKNDIVDEATAKLFEKYFKATDPAYLNRILCGKVKQYAEMVDDDWHVCSNSFAGNFTYGNVIGFTVSRQDGYEEQGLIVSQFESALRLPLMAIYGLAIRGGKDFVRCHEAMKIIADACTWLGEIPSRISASECFGEEWVKDEISGHRVFAIKPYPDYIWPRLLHAAAAATGDNLVSDDDLTRFIKDLEDFNYQPLRLPALNDIDELEEDEEELDKNELNDKARKEVLMKQISGHARLEAVYKTNAWKQLPSTRPQRKIRPAIDRRFFGDKSRRTRYFSDDDDDDDEDEYSD